VLWRSRVNRPVSWLLLGLALAVLLVLPFGNYPLNDDWQYARILKRLAESGRYLVDVEIAPSLVGQVWLALPLVKLFGFSHTLLRLQTIAVTLVLLWIVDRIVALAGATRPIRVLTAVLLLGNPIFLHLTFSFMTEMYGYALALAGALLWLRSRERHLQGAPLVSWRAGLLASALMGASFWIRQFCVAVFPALLCAAALRLALEKDGRALRKSVPVLAGSTALFTLVVLLYFEWARASGNLRSAFQVRVDALSHVDARLVYLSAFELVSYLTAFLFPFFWYEKWRFTRWAPLVGMVAGGAVLLYFARDLQPEYASFHHHPSFPFSANLVNDTNVGPITLTTQYWFRSAPRPRWPEGVWGTIEWLVVGGSLRAAPQPIGGGDSRFRSSVVCHQLRSVCAGVPAGGTRSLFSALSLGPAVGTRRPRLALWRAASLVGAARCGAATLLVHRRRCA
jgi:hypothetical protein